MAIREPTPLSHAACKHLQAARLTSHTALTLAMTATTPTRLKFLVLSARAPVALDWARQIVAAGHEVYLADYGAGNLGRASGLAQSFWTLPAPADAPLAFIQRLQQILAQERIDWLIPTCEEVFCVALFRALLPA